MSHLGIDIDYFILYTLFPAAAFFAIGYIAKKTNMRPVLSYLLQAVTCFAFSIVYFIAVLNGGAQGLAIVLAMFGALLLFMARKHKIQQPEEQQNVE
jgi:peptidoglycan/LPS O-acetylase OafA/YrhL